MRRFLTYSLGAMMRRLATILPHAGIAWSLALALLLRQASLSTAITNRGSTKKRIAVLFSFLFGALWISPAFGVITWTPGATVAWQLVPFGTTATFTGLNGGTNYIAGSFACAAFATKQGSAGIAPFTITIGGVTPSLIVADGSGFANLYCASISSSSPDTVVISGANNTGWEAVAGGYFTGSATTATATGINSSNTSGAETILVGGTGAATTITNPSGGVGIVAVYDTAGTAGTSCSTPT